MPTFKNLISKIAISQTVRLKTIRDTSLIKSLTLAETLFSNKPRAFIKEIKYRFKEKIFMAKTETILYNNNLREVLNMFSAVYFPQMKRFLKKLGYQKVYYYQSKSNNLTFLFPSRLFGLWKSEIPINFKGPVLIRFFLSKHCFRFFNEFIRIFPIFFLSKFIKFPLIRYGLRRRVNKKKKFLTLNNIMKIIR